MVKNPPCNAVDMGLIPGWGAKTPHAAKQISPHATTTEPIRHNCKFSATTKDAALRNKDPRQPGKYFLKNSLFKLQLPCPLGLQSSEELTGTVGSNYKMAHFKQMINWHWLLVGGTSVSLHLRLFMGYLFVFMTTGSFLLGKEFKRERGRSYHVFYDLSLEDMVSPSFLPYSSLNARWPYLMWEETLHGVNTRGYPLPRSLTLFSLCVSYSSFKLQLFFFKVFIIYLLIWLCRVSVVACGI